MASFVGPVGLAEQAMELGQMVGDLSTMELVVGGSLVLELGMDSIVGCKLVVVVVELDRRFVVVDCTMVAVVVAEPIHGWAPGSTRIAM